MLKSKWYLQGYAIKMPSLVRLFLPFLGQTSAKMFPRLACARLRAFPSHPLSFRFSKKATNAIFF